MNKKKEANVLFMQILKHLKKTNKFFGVKNTYIKIHENGGGIMNDLPGDTRFENLTQLRKILLVNNDKLNTMMEN